MVVHLFLNNNKDLDFLPINSIKNGGVTNSTHLLSMIKDIGKGRLSGKLKKKISGAEPIQPPAYIRNAIEYIVKHV